MKKKNKLILIIGGTGFIGFNLIKKLIKKNFKIESISTRLPNSEKRVKGVKYLICDISNKKKLKKIIGVNKKYDYVLNLGGNVNHRDKVKTLQSHYLGIKNLTSIFLKKSIKKFIQVGSSVEYGNIKSPHKENNIFKVKNLKSSYGKAKLSASNLLLYYNKKFNFPVIILRPYLIYGPHQDLNRILPIIISACIKKEKFDCSDGKQYRDFLFIDDFVRLIEKLLNERKILNGQIFNVGFGKPIKIKDVINSIVEKIKGGKPTFGAIRLRKDEILKMYPSILKIKKFTKWRPRIPFETGLKRTIFYYEKKLKN